MKEPESIEKFREYPKSMDFVALKKEGIEKVQELCGDIWTDYNEHDPGVTILENICYALTELGYKTNFDIEDLFYSDRSAQTIEAKTKHTLFKIDDIYPCAPITLQDYRKLIIDHIPSVKNAWLVPLKSSRLGLAVLGLYKVQLQLEDHADPQGTYDAIKSLLSQNRNLCEDFDEIKILKAQKVQVGAIISVGSNVIGESVLSDIYHRLAEELSPHHSFLNLDEMLAMGHSLEEVYDGPVAKNGFISNKSLDNSSIEKVNRIYRSKLIKIISNVPGVVSINNFTVYIDGEAYNEEFIELPDDTYPSLDIEGNIDREQIQLVSDGIVYSLNNEVLRYSLEILSAKSQKKHKRILSTPNKKVETQRAKEDIQFYYSLQNTFPRIYGITEYGIQGKETSENKAYAKQLKGYLVLIEQLLANYLAQLVNVDKLFSLDDFDASYFGQNLHHVPMIEEILGQWDAFENAHSDLIEKYDNYLVRRSRFLDHLMGRLGEEFLTESANAIQRESNAYNRDGFLEKSIRSKIALLRDYVNISRNRGKGVDYGNVDESTKILSTAVTEKVNYLFNLQADPQNALSSLQGEKDLKTSKAKSTAKVDDKSFSFSSSNPDLLAEVMACGVDRNQYSIDPVGSTGKQYQINYRSPVTNNEFPVYQGKSVEDCEEALEAFIQKISDYNVKSEGFHLIEHILLRPTGESVKFTIYSDQGVLASSGIIEGDPEMAKEDFVKDILQHGQDKKNYKVEKQGKNYVVKLHGAKSKLLFENNSFIKKSSADDHVKYCIQFVKASAKKENALENAMSMEQVSKQGMEFESDPFSFQCSAVAPRYSGSFQNDKSKKLFEMLVKANFPAHLKMNFIWLSLDEMSEFERVYQAWITQKSSTGSSANLDDLSYVLMKALRNKLDGAEMIDKEMSSMIGAII